MPPSCAIAIASRASVTVSIAADTIGMFSAMPRVRRVLSETSRGTTTRMRGDQQDVVEREGLADDTHPRKLLGAKTDYTRAGAVGLPSGH